MSGGDANHMQPTPTHSKEEVSNAFQRIFGFTADDLAANRMGQLTEAQKERLQKAHWVGRGGNIGLYFGLGFIILFVIGVIVLLNSSLGPGILANPNAPRIFGVSALVVLLFAFSLPWS